MKKLFKLSAISLGVLLVVILCFKNLIIETITSSVIDGRVKNVILSKYKSKRIIYIDYSKPSYKKRLWVLDGDSVLLNTYVSHGKNSGLVYAKKFSNEPETNMSCVGRFITLNTYNGNSGLSLRIMGIDSTNSNTFKRKIVFHGSDYVNEKYLFTHGYMGRSLGCFATSFEDNKKIIDLVKEKFSVMVIVVK